MKHLKHMAIGGVAIFAVLLLFGVPLGTSVQYALLLACPVMMMGMMFFMNHGSGQSSGSCHHDHSTASGEATSMKSESTRQK